MPAACVRNCLRGNPDLARTHGCALIRLLAVRQRMHAPAPLPPEVDVPEVCERGYKLWLTPSNDTSEPDVLVLRRSAEGDAGDGTSDGALHTLRTTAIENWRLNQETDGLASEVLRSYEQINLIFDVSAEIAILNDASEVQQMLLTKLRHLFDADAVYFVAGEEDVLKVVTRDGRVTRTWLSAVRHSGASVSPELSLPTEFEQARERLQESRRVLVCSDNSALEQTGHGTSMWGPLNDGTAQFSIVGIVRRSSPFVAGDMLVLDSALTYGSHILSNLRLVEQLKRTSFEAVRALVNAIDQKDNYTSGHSERVGFLAKITGLHLGLPAVKLQELEWAGLLHDVGKIGIPERVLNKPGKLTEEEFSLIRQHPARSFEVLRPVASLEPVLEAVLYHHENPDGSGYPKGLRGDEIPLSARIVHVVDVFDALTSTRSYRSAFNAERAITLLRQDAGTKLDAQIVDAFVAAWRNLPTTHPEQYHRWFHACTEVDE